MKKKILFISTILLTNNLFGNQNYTNLIKNIKNKRTSDRTIKFLKVNNDPKIINILLNNYKEENRYINKLLKSNSITTSVLLFKMLDDFDDLKKRLEYKKILKNVNKQEYKKIREIRPFTKENLNKYLENNFEKINYKYKDIKELQKNKIKSFEKNEIDNNLNTNNNFHKNNQNNIKYKIKFSNLDLGKYENLSLTQKDKELLKKIYINIMKNGYNKEYLEELQYFGKIITPILRDTIFNKNKSIRIISFKLLKLNNELEKIFEDLLDEISFNKENKNKLYYIPNIKEYEKELLKSFKKTTYENQKEIIPIMKELKLNLITKEFDLIELNYKQMKKQREIEELKFLQEEFQKEKEMKIKLLEKEEQEKIKNKIKSNKLREEIKKRNKILKEKYKKDNNKIIKKETLNERILNKETRYNAILEAGEKLNKDVIPVLKTILFDKENKYTKKEKKQSLFVIIKIGNKECIEILKKIKNTDKSLSFLATRGLQTLNN